MHFLFTYINQKVTTIIATTIYEILKFVLRTKFFGYRVQSKVVRRSFSLQPLVPDVYIQLQNWFKKCKDLCYGIFKFQKSIL